MSSVFLASLPLDASAFSWIESQFHLWNKMSATPSISTWKMKGLPFSITDLPPLPTPPISVFFRKTQTSPFHVMPCPAQPSPPQPDPAKPYLAPPDLTEPILAAP